MTTTNFLRTVLRIGAKNIGNDTEHNLHTMGGGDRFSLLKAPSSHLGNTNQFSSTERFQSNLNCNTTSSEVDAISFERLEHSSLSHHSQASKSKKSFFPLFSLVLSAFLLPFTADIAQAIQAAPIRPDILSADHGNLNRVEVYSQGDARCLLSGDEACGRVTQSIAKMFQITQNQTYSDVYYIYYNYRATIRNPASTATFYFNNSVAEAKAGSRTIWENSDFNKKYIQAGFGIQAGNGQNIDAYFKNSAYKGDFSFYYGGFAIPTYYTFDGNYTGTSYDSLKGKAFVGNMNISAGAPVFTFKNGAVAEIGYFKNLDWDAAKYSYGLNVRSGAKVHIKDYNVSVATGVVNVDDQANLKIDSFGYNGFDMTFKVTNGSILEITRFQQNDGKQSASGMYWGAPNPNIRKEIYVDNSTLKGDFTLTKPTDQPGQENSKGNTNFQIKFFNNAKFEGKLINNASTALKSTVGVSVSNSTLPTLDYTQNGSDKTTPTFSIVNNSDVGFKNVFKNAANFNVTDSKLRDIKNTVGGEMHFNTKNANIGNIDITDSVKATAWTSGGVLTGTFDSSNIGNINTLSNWADNISITNTQGKENLKIGNINFGNGKQAAANGVKLNINLNKNAQVGNINANQAQITAKFDGASVGNITSKNTDTSKPSSLIFTNTAGQSIGKIGDSTNAFNGDIKGTFDFTPVTGSDGTTKQLSLGDINSSSTSKNDMSFVFGGADKDGNTKGKPSTPINISGGSKDSSYTFANLGKLSTTGGKDISSVANIKFSDNVKMSSFNLVGTSVHLGKGESLDASSVSKLLGVKSSSLTDLKSASYNFGNAKVVSNPDGTTKIVPNTDASGNPVFSTLTQEGVTHKPGDGFVAGKSSDANIKIPLDGSNFKQSVSFNFTPNAFDAKKGESAWTGKFDGNSSNVNFSFNNAGRISNTQLGTTDNLNVKLQGTTLTGVIGGDVKVPIIDAATGQPQKDEKGNVKTQTKAQDVTLSVDASAGSVTDGLSIIGDGKHDITLDFSGNNAKDKFTGAILGGNADSSITIKNLDGINISQTGGGSIVDGLKNAGVSGINNPDAAKNPDGSKQNIPADKKQNINTATEFKIQGSDIKGNIKDANYKYNLSFDTNANRPSDETGKEIPAAHYSGNSIDFSSNSNDQSISFSGEGSINPNNHQALNVHTGTGNTKLNFNNTGATVVLHNTDKAGDDSSLSIKGTSLIGDWNKGTTDAQFDSKSKFYGVLGGSKDKPVVINLQENSLYSSNDPVVQAAYEGKLKGTDSSGKPIFGIPEIDLSTTGLKDVSFNDPGELLKLSGLSKENGLDKGNLVASNMSLIGNLYSKLDEKARSKVKANLSFRTDSTDDKEDTSLTTDHIGVFADGSSVSFYGEGSLKALTPYDATTKTGGVVTISLGGFDSGNTNFNFNNTGANVVFSQVKGQKDVKGNFNIRGTNIALDNGLSAWAGSKVNLVFANASANTKDTLLKTQDGTLLTSNKDAQGHLKNISDYVDTSTLSLKAGTVSFKGTDNQMTFIGDTSVLATPLVTKPMELSGNAKAQINLINMGTALAISLQNIIQAQGGKIDDIATALATLQAKQSGLSDESAIAAYVASAKSTILTALSKQTMADLLMQNNNGGGAGSVQYTYNLKGTTLGSLNIAAPLSADGKNQTNVIINAIFDNRELQDRESDDLKYYENSNAIGASKLEIAKAALNGNLAMDNHVHAHFSFIGEDAINSNAKITGGASDSTFLFQDLSLNFGAGSGFSNLGMNGKVILNGVNAKGTFQPTGKVNFVSLNSDKKEITGLVFKNYEDNQEVSTLSDNLDKDGHLFGTNANLSDILKVKNTSFIGTIDSSSPTVFTFAGKNSSGFTSNTTSNATSLGSNAKDVTLNLIDVGVVQVSNINAGAKTDAPSNTINLYGQSALSLNTVGSKTSLSVGGNDNVIINALIDKSNAALWGANDQGSLGFDIEGSTEVNSIYHITFNGGIPYPSTDQSFYTGQIGLLNTSSVINFIDAGNLRDSQFENTKAAVNLTRTTVSGDIFFNTGLLDFSNGNSAFSGSVVSKDPNDNKKDLYFNFTGNNKADKIFNNTGKDHNFYLSGGEGSVFTFINLVDNHFTSSPTPIVWQSRNSTDSVFNTLGFNGVHFRAADNARDYKMFGGSKVYQNLDANTTFRFVGTSITGNINSGYNLDFTFYNAKGSITAYGTAVELNEAFYNGTSIASDKNLSINAIGAGSFGSQEVSLKAGGTLKMSASSDDGEVGSIYVASVNAGSSLNINHLGFRGRFVTSKDANNEGGDITANFTGSEVQDGFVFGTKDGSLNLSLSDTTLNNAREQKILIGNANTVNLNFNNANIIKIYSSDKSFEDTITDAASQTTWGENTEGGLIGAGSITSRGTSIIGDLYTQVDAKSKKSSLLADLSFDSTSNNPSFYQGNYIGALKGGSKLSFIGKGSLRSQDKSSTNLKGYDALTKSDTGTVQIDLAGNSDALDLTLNNTGANVALNQDGNKTGWFVRGNFNVRGTNLSLKNGLDTDFGGNISINAVFARAQQSTQYSLLSTKGGNLLTDAKDINGNAKDINDYVEASTLNVGNRLQIRGGTHYFTFIGDASVLPSTDTVVLANFASVVNTNLINLGNALLASIPIKDASDNLSTITAGSILFKGATGGGGSTATYNYTLRGTNLGETTIASGSASNDTEKVKVNFNAIFDARDLNNRVDSNGDAQEDLQYYSDAKAIGNTKLEIAKSSLSGALKLGSNDDEAKLVNANVFFYGQGSFGENASITGGSSTSNVFFSNLANLDYLKFNTFNGTSYVVNSSMSGNLADDANASATSTQGVLKAYFNQNMGDMSDMSEKAKEFVDAANKALSGGIKLNLSTDHIFNAAIGKTAGSLHLAFIGSNATGSNFKIGDDNKANIYSFVDYGKIDLATLASNGSSVNGTIKWVGNSYQVGKVHNSVDANVDVNTAGDEIKHNEYQAQDGKQDINFDFGGSINNPDGSKKEIGTIKDASDIKDDKGNVVKKGGATADSTYSVSNLTNSSSSNPNDHAFNTNNDNIINSLNQLLNPNNDASKDPFQNTTGTIGIKDTNIKGDLNQNKNYKDSAGNDKQFTGTIAANFDSTNTSNPSSLDGNIKGDATKNISFKGEGSSGFKNDKTISGGDKNSQYSFNDVGTLDTKAINNILNGGETYNGSGTAKASNAGNFNFDGSTSIKGNITDAANTSNIKDQTINIGKDKTTSPHGMQYEGDISTSAKVDANFGVGTKVKIINKNAQSVYDFSNFANEDAPVVAEIDMDSYQKGRVVGFNGSVSLIGSIQDINNTGNQYKFVGGNGKKAGQWILTKDSSVDYIGIGNKEVSMEALNAPTLNNPLAIIDLRGEDAFNSNIAGASLMGGAFISGATGGFYDNYVPLNISIKTLDATNGVWRLGVNLANGTSSMINISNVASSTNRVNYVQFFPQKTGNLNAPILFANVGASISPNFFKGVESKVGLRIYTPTVVGMNVTRNAGSSGGTSGTPDVKSTEYYLTALSSSINSDVVTPIEQTLSSAYRNFRVETNNLHLRMGELRGIGASQGAWGRVMNGMGSDDNNKDFYTTIQAGYDYKFDVLGGVNYVGVVADTSIITSKGNDYQGTGNTLGLGIYNTYLMDNGLYVDAITKYLYMHNRIDSLTTSEQILGNHAFLLGAEVGYRYHLDSLLPLMKIALNPYTKGYYVEPQVEIIYGYIGGNNFHTSINSVSEASSISATLEGNHALISRIGAVFGKEIRTNGFYGDIRLGISYVNEANTGGNTSLVDSISPDAITSSTPSNNKLNLSLGTNVKINEDWRVYADVSRTFFGIYNIDYNLNIGARFNFGKKTSAYQRNIQAQKEQEAKRAKQQQASKNNLGIQASKILSIDEAKNKCQGCAPESGYYYKVVTLSSKNANLEKQLKKYPYRIYSFKDNKNQTLHSYLVGPYVDKAQLDSHKADIDKLTQWANNNNNAQAEVYEVKNAK
ncbi:hypothetical protein BKH42_02845 [Helicobacter sp. 13S00482-2]|uniref:hypothetical protein n=1 Tax=Helicobacter sp. 13S00482-2 TaxID=1476200 RepID=UPI000BA57493|nr:hypothetical protein [Helicobacter sp. 13S00482-2]PAF53924.1 hypothetical protein BKH42_02845 [Helicobacter sp. 13S00482-2]